MKAEKTKFEDFKDEKLTKNQLKTVRGGDEIIDPKDPNKGGTGHGGTP